MFSSSDEVHDVSISWNYILLSVTYNFGPGEWAKIERNDSKPLCPKTLLVDWGVYVQWAQRVSKTICQNRMGFSYIFSWSCQVWQLTPPFFPNVSTFEKRLQIGCIKIAMIAFVDAFCAGKRQWTTSRHSYQLHLLSRHLAALTMNNSAICFTL